MNIHFQNTINKKKTAPKNRSRFFIISVVTESIDYLAMMTLFVVTPLAVLIRNR